MKIKKLHIILLTTLLLTFSISLEANSSKGNLTIRQKRLVERNDTLFLSMDIVFSGRVIASAYGLKLVPVLKSGNKSVDLPYVLINGKQRASYYEREKALLPYGSNKLDGLYASITSQGDSKQSQFIRYSVTVPYQSWMKNASLLLRQLQTDCCTETLLSYDIITSDAKMRQTRQKNTSNASNFAAALPQKRVNFIKPNAEPVKTRIKSTSTYVNYPQGKSEVLPHFASNASELSKVRDILLPVLTNDLYTLEKVIVVGCASPEGLYSTNEKLSSTRAYHFREYLKTTYNLSNSSFSVSHIAEDWNKLVDLIAIYPVPDKARVLDLIKRTQVPDEREEKLKRLSAGNPYQYIYQNIYPKLRRIDVTIHYTVKSFEDRDIERIYRTNPEDLSLSEFYQLAQNYKQGSKQHRQVFETAVRYYPNEPIANINAAAVALQANDTETARRYLAKVSKDRRAKNNLEVYKLLRNGI